MTAPNVSHGDRDAALNNEILRTVVGSGVHGLAIAGTDDRDEMGIYIEPRENVYGVAPELPHYISRTQPEGARSGPGDIDLTMYSLRKYLRLATKGNPTVLLPLFAPERDILIYTDLGGVLRGGRHLFLSQQAVHRFIGYAHAQHERMMGGGKRNRVPNRPELVEKYGWDVKFGSHALRLVLQGLELATSGTLTLPMEPAAREVVLMVKRGQVKQSDVSAMVTATIETIESVLGRGGCPLPVEPPIEAISTLSVSMHEQHWATQ